MWCHHRLHCLDLFFFHNRRWRNKDTIKACCASSCTTGSGATKLLLWKRVCGLWRSMGSNWASHSTFVQQCAAAAPSRSFIAASLRLLWRKLWLRQWLWRWRERGTIRTTRWLSSCLQFQFASDTRRCAIDDQQRSAVSKNIQDVLEGFRFIHHGHSGTNRSRKRASQHLLERAGNVFLEAARQPLHGDHHLAQDGIKVQRNQEVHRVSVAAELQSRAGFEALQKFRLASWAAGGEILSHSNPTAPWQADFRSLRGTVHRASTCAAPAVCWLGLPSSDSFEKRRLDALLDMQRSEEVESWKEKRREGSSEFQYELFINPDQ